jgi:hypothetical protein
MYIKKKNIPNVTPHAPLGHLRFNMKALCIYVGSLVLAVHHQGPDKPLTAGDPFYIVHCYTQNEMHHFGGPMENQNIWQLFKKY